jgi:hypothetical protein
MRLPAGDLVECFDPRCNPERMDSSAHGAQPEAAEVYATSLRARAFVESAISKIKDLFD